MQHLSTHPIKVWFYHRLLALAARIQGIPAKVTPPPFRLLQIGSAFWQSRALYVATRLQVAEAVGDTPKSTQALAHALGLHEDHLYRLLRLLASLGIFHETAPRTFANSPASHYLREDNPANIRAMILMHNSPEMVRPWLEPLEDCMRSGDIPFKQAHGADLFSYMDAHPAFDRLFAQAMDSVENLTGIAFLDDFNWGAFQRVIDVGGSRGHKALTILNAHPHLRAIVFDRPQVIAEASTAWQGKVAADVLERVTFQAGDMLESIPVADSDEDVYAFSAIFHGLSDADSRRLLLNIKHACGEKRPWVLIADAVLAESGADSTLASFDMQMLIGTAGRERTLSEWQQLLAGSGFTLVKVLDVRTFAKFLVLRRDTSTSS
jgi:hypothetical protein